MKFLNSILLINMSLFIPRFFCFTTKDVYYHLKSVIVINSSSPVIIQECLSIFNYFFVGNLRLMFLHLYEILCWDFAGNFIDYVGCF